MYDNEKYEGIQLISLEVLVKRPNTSFLRRQESRNQRLTIKNMDSRLKNAGMTGFCKNLVIVRIYHSQ